MKPTGRDTTGGYRKWLQLQTYLATMVTSALFCFSTGQLEAWWTIYDRHACSPPSMGDMSWKFPQCDVNWPGEQAADALALEVIDSQISSANSTCWEDAPPTLPACPFDAIDINVAQDDDALEEFAGVVGSCLQDEATRPSAAEVAEELGRLQDGQRQQPQQQKKNPHVEL